MLHSLCKGLERQHDKVLRKLLNAGQVDVTDAQVVPQHCLNQQHMRFTLPHSVKVAPIACKADSQQQAAIT